jgi:ABC-type Mn2+/Zn2+ transport system permease subunit
MEIFGETFVLYALAAGIMIGGLCSFLGVWVVLKRIVFLGAALAEVSALGVAAGLMIGIDPVASSLALAVLAAVLFWMPAGERSLSRESVIGYVYVLAAALTVVLIALNPAAESRGLDLVSGNLLYVEGRDLVIVGALAAAMIVMHSLLYRTFLFVSFDPETARASGIRSAAYDLLIYLGIGVTVGVTMKVAGFLFVFGSLVVPPMAGLLLFRRMAGIIAGSVACGVVSAAGGIALSIRLDWPTAPAILLVSCAITALIALAGAGARLAGRRSVRP